MVPFCIRQQEIAAQMQHETACSWMRAGREMYSLWINVLALLIVCFCWDRAPTFGAELWSGFIAFVFIFVWIEHHMLYFLFWIAVCTETSLCKLKAAIYVNSRLTVTKTTQCNIGRDEHLTVVWSVFKCYEHEEVFRIICCRITVSGYQTLMDGKHTFCKLASYQASFKLKPFAIFKVIFRKWALIKRFFF